MRCGRGVTRRLGAETVLISVAGMPPERAAAGAAPAAETRSDGLDLAGGEAGGSYASDLVAFTRATIDKHMAGNRHGTWRKGRGSQQSTAG
ncbi:hypothetical protein [Cereibacter johrii]|uniref:Uncharacterized protein n=1 Tax=Cereibacter johrii TaxID=445629 RepID=A0ABX5J3J2_9RHOB|nr:hypothetical protein [Cereibacter johrii]PTM75605.1 hypothetical protein C8J29_11185 [Cereibacter johrii]